MHSVSGLEEPLVQRQIFEAWSIGIPATFQETFVGRAIDLLLDGLAGWAVSVGAIQPARASRMISPSQLSFWNLPTDHRAR
jgi:hypothetical protein